MWQRDDIGKGGEGGGTQDWPILYEFGKYNFSHEDGTFTVINIDCPLLKCSASSIK